MAFREMHLCTAANPTTPKPFVARRWLLAIWRTCYKSTNMDNVKEVLVDKVWQENAQHTYSLI